MAPSSGEYHDEFDDLSYDQVGAMCVCVLCCVRVVCAVRVSNSSLFSCFRFPLFNILLPAAHNPRRLCVCVCMVVCGEERVTHTHTHTNPFARTKPTRGEGAQRLHTRASVLDFAQTLTEGYELRGGEY